METYREQIRAVVQAAFDVERDWQPDVTHPAMIELRDRAIDEHRAGKTEPMDLDADWVAEPSWTVLEIVEDALWKAGQGDELRDKAELATRVM